MIRDFGDRETERVWNRERSRVLPSKIQATARRKMLQLNRIAQPAELRIPPGNRFEELKGERKGTYSVRVNGQW